MAAYFAKITAAPRGQGGDDFGHSAEKPRLILREGTRGEAFLYHQTRIYEPTMSQQGLSGS